MANEVNPQRAKRQGFDKGGSYGEQGGHGNGSVKCSADGASKPAAKFQDASSFLGQEVTGELNVPGVSIVKGASVPGGVPLRKGEKNVGKPSVGEAQVPLNGKNSGYK